MGIDAVMNLATGAAALKAPPLRSNPWVRGDKAYRSTGRAGTGKLLYLDANESAGSAEYLSTLLGLFAAESGSWSRYPDCGELEALIARRYGVDPARVVLCAGADDGIQRVVSACLNPGERILEYVPGFVMYGLYAGIRGGGSMALPWMPDGGFPLSASLDRIANCPSLSLLCLASPANPTGNIIKKSQFFELAEAARSRGTNLLLDTVYEDFCQDPLGMDAARRGLAYVAGSFSKSRALAGFRLGWVVAPDAARAECLRAAGGPYPVSAPALLAGRLAMERQADFEADWQAIRSSREELAQALAELGCRPSRSEANFLFVPQGGRKLASDLLAQDIVVRTWNETGLLADACRITVPARPVDSERLKQALRASDKRGAQR